MTVITTTSQFDALAQQTSHSFYWVVKLYYNDETSFLGLSTKDVDIDGSHYYGVITNPGALRATMDWQTHEPAVNAIQMTCANFDAIVGESLDDAVSSYNFINRKVEIYIYHDDFTALSQGMLIFEGVTKSKKKDNTDIVLGLESNLISDNVKIPQTLVDRATYPNAPDANIGKPIPLWYGDFDWNTFTTGYPHAQLTTNGYYAAAIITDRDGITCKADTEPINLLRDKGYFLKSGNFMIYNAELTGPTTSTANATVTYTNTYWRLQVKPLSENVSSDATNYANAVDDDKDTFASLYKTGTAGDEALILFNKPVTEKLGELKDISVWWYGKGNSGSVSAANTDIEAYYDGTLTTTVADATSFDDGDVSFIFFTSLVTGTDAENTWDFQTMGIDMKIQGTGDHQIDIGILSLGIDYHPTVISKTNRRQRDRNFRFRDRDGGRGSQAPELTRGEYVSIDNVEYTWLAGQGRVDDGSGTVTGTADSLIENPSHVIEHLLRTEASVAAADIDTSGFDTAATDNSLDIGFSLYAQEDLLPLIYDICQASMMYVWKSTTGIYRAQVWKSSWSSSDVSLTFNYADVFDDEYTDTDFNDIRNDITVNYNRNYPLDVYEGEATASDTTSQGTTASGYNITAALQFDNDYIKDSTSASTFATWLKNKYANPRTIVTFSTAQMRYYPLELLDIVQLDSNWPDADGTAVNTLYFMIIGQVKTPQGMEFTLLEVS